jgi:hypothetical protein
MLITRIAHALIVGIVAIAAVAIVMVLRPDTATHPSELEFQQVINYSRYGVIDTIEVRGREVTAHFRDDFDTKEALGVDAHTFVANGPADEDVVAALKAGGVPDATAGGPTISVESP